MSLFLLGLTGSIGTGKSTTAQMMRDLNLPVFDADQEVHRLLSDDTDVVTAISKAFPECVQGGRVNRQTLGARVARTSDDLRLLEKVIHPRIQEACRTFIATCRSNGVSFAVLEIPLLYEKGYELLCDKVIVTVCQEALQKERVMARPGMTQEKYDMIAANQINGAQKAARADYVLITDNGELETLQGLRQILSDIGFLEEGSHAQHCS